MKVFRSTITLLITIAVVWSTHHHVRAATINNLAPRLDVNGVIMDAHDGTVRKFSPDGPYYMHAISYGLCKEPPNYGCDMTSVKCGFQMDHNISIYTSETLESGSWTYVGNAIDVTQRPAGILYRSHAIYNPNTQQYVLWWNSVIPPAYAYVVATAPTPAGPFVVQTKSTSTAGGDFDLFVDDDGTGYLLNSANGMFVWTLRSDFLDVANPSQPDFSFPETFVEAPTLFKRKGYYYALFDWCCCFCYQGSGIQVWTATALQGPWTQQAGGDVACVSSSDESHLLGAIPTPGQGCQYHDPTTTSTTRSQQNFVIQVNSSSGIEYIWTGDRWQQAPDGIKGHEPQFWVPLKFNDSVVPATILPVTWVDVFDF